MKDSDFFEIIIALCVVISTIILGTVYINYSSLGYTVSAILYGTAVITGSIIWMGLHLKKDD